MGEKNEESKRHRGGKSVEKHTTALMLKDEEIREHVLGRIEDVRSIQRAEGHFDCFGKAVGNYCDQGECAFYAECMSISTLVSQPFP